jgi:hypothetical protein
MNNQELGDAVGAAYDALDKAAKALDRVRKVAPPDYSDDVIRKAITLDRETDNLAQTIADRVADLLARVDRLEVQRPKPPAEKPEARNGR